MVSAGFASADPCVESGRGTRFYPLIGVFRLCAGDDRLDVIPVGSVYTQLRGVLRAGPWVHPVDDHRRALLPGPSASRHVDSRSRQLVGKLPRRYRFSDDEGEKLFSFRCSFDIVG